MNSRSHPQETRWLAHWPEFGGRWLALALGLVGAVALGYWIGTAQLVWGYWSLTLALAAVTVAGFRQHAWMLIYLGWTMTGYTGFLPYRLSLRDVCIILAVVAYFAYSAVGKRRLRLRWLALDWVLVANLAWLTIVYLRNPAGLLLFGAETIGARPYVNIALATACYWVTTRLPTSARLVAFIPLMMLAGSAVGTILHLLAFFTPGLAVALQPVYVFFSVTAYQWAEKTQQSTGILRLMTGPFGLLLVQVLCSYYPPRQLINPLHWRSWAFVLGLLSIFFSGFRSYLLNAFAQVGIGSWLRRGWRELALISVLGGLLLGGLIVGQGRFYTLPTNVQRAMAWLPGKWDPEVVMNVEGSNTRFEWWRRILRERQITDWWLGQGFGASYRDAAAMHWTGTATFEQGMELWGGYHNGPLSTIRVAGVVGLILYYTLMIMSAYYATKFVRLCQGSPLYPLAIFVALDVIWRPFHFMLVFGGYDSALPQSIIMLGLLRLVIRMREEQPPTATVPAPTTTVAP